MVKEQQAEGAPRSGPVPTSPEGRAPPPMGAPPGSSSGPDEVEAYLHAHIPLSAAMGVQVRALDADGVLLEAPLEPNLNHRATAFGGSLSALAILAGWALVHFRLRQEGHAVRTVIHESSVRYDAPVHGGFEARALTPPEARWRRFAATLARRGKARIRVEIELSSEGRAVGRCTASYVALATHPGAYAPAP